MNDESSLHRVQRSMKKGSLREGHEMFHRRTRSEASDCIAQIVSLPRPVYEISLPDKIPDAMVPHDRLVRDVRPKTASNAEFIERYNLAIEEEDRRSKERARSVRGSLERIRGRGSVRRVVSRAAPMEQKEDSETAGSEEPEEVTEEERGQERLRRELKGIFGSPT